MKNKKALKKMLQKKPLQFIGNGIMDFEIVGESFYQENIKKALNTNESVYDEPIIARLQLEDYNPYDENAIGVYINNYKVGHIPKRRNKRIRLLFAFANNISIQATCNGSVYGGGDRFYGVWLDLDFNKTKKHLLDLKKNKKL